jgi:thiamine biosynthesis lipoprotein
LEVVLFPFGSAKIEVIFHSANFCGLFLIFFFFFLKSLRGRPAFSLEISYLYANKSNTMQKLVLFSVLLLAACGRADYDTFTGYAQGTTYSIVVKNPPEGFGEKIDAVFEDVDLTFSIFNTASLTSRMNSGETDAATPLFERCFALAKEVHALTEGFYDPTVKPLVDAWGFGSGASRTGAYEENPNVDSLMEYVGLDKVDIRDGRVVKADPRVQLDFSSIAKGLTVDLLAELALSEGITEYMVEVGGEVRIKGVNEAGRAWRIGIDKPVVGLGRELETVAVPTVDLPAIATSGNYRNQFVDASGRTRVHTIDPLTGLPAEGDILSVSIAAPECALADAWATGLMAARSVENARRILAAAGTAANAGNALAGNAAAIEYFIIYSIPGDGNSTAVLHSPNFPLEK